MKTLFLSSILILFTNSGFASAFFDNPIPIPVLSNVTKELSHLLNETHTDDVLYREELAKITFTVNNLNRIVLLHVSSNNSDVQDFVEQALNNKKLSSNELVVGENYVFEAIFKN